MLPVANVVVCGTVASTGVVGAGFTNGTVSDAYSTSYALIIANCY